MLTAEIKTEYDAKSEMLTLIISGEIYHHTAGRLRTEADRELAVRRPKNLIIDLTDVSFMDSAGLGYILGRYGKAQAIGAATSIRGASAQILRILRLAGAEKYIKIIK